MDATDTPQLSTHKYHVALSYAGEDRAYVDSVAKELHTQGLSVFYDKYEEASLWGKDLYKHLSDVYTNQASFTLIFVSHHYSNKLWTNHELKSAQSRAFQENREYILPIRFDSTELPGVTNTTGYILAGEKSPKEVADLVWRKLVEHKLAPFDHSNDETLLPLAKLISIAFQSSPDTPADLATPSANKRYSDKAAYDYVEYCHNLYQNMRILAMPKPVELSHIFTQVRIADRIRSRLSASETDVIKDIVAARHGPDTASINAALVFRQRSRSVLLGRPGSGKSTFLKYMLLRELQSDKVSQIPILLPLNELNQRNISLLNSIEEILKQAQVPHPSLLLTTLLQQGRVKLLIDGLDELRVDDRGKIIKEIETLINNYRSCSFVITCRTSAYEFWFGDCHHYEVQRFSGRAIVYFVKRWFSEDRKKARALLQQILPSGRMRDLCSSPLMLTIVCIGFESGIDLSNNRAEIYKDATDALLKKWDASRSIYRDNIYRNLTPKRREDMLCDLAARSFVDNLIVIPSKYAEEVVGKFLHTMPTSPDIDIGRDAAIVLQAIETQHGLIEKRSLQFWAFAHLTFQEFFVAQYLVSKDPELRNRVARDHVDKPEWREVIMLTAALLSNADEYVLDILRALTKMGYGEYFVKQTEREIKEARRSSDHLRFRSEGVFPYATPDGSRATRLQSRAFGVIEGGVRLSVSEIQLALLRFREVIAARTRPPTFDAVINAGRSYVRIVEGFLAGEVREGDEKGAENSEEGSLETQQAETVELKCFLLMQRRAPPIVRFIETTMLDRIREADLSSSLGIESRSKLLLALLECYSVFESENADVAEKLNRIYEPNNLFEMTSRKYMFVVPACLDECLAEANAVLEHLIVSGTRTLLEKKLLNLPISAEKAEKILIESVGITIRRIIERAAHRNKTEAGKLRAFIAGDTLAEVLMSQAFLTPIVREAAVRTLNNMVGNIPQPPTDEPPAETVKTRLYG